MLPQVAELEPPHGRCGVLVALGCQNRRHDPDRTLADLLRRITPEGAAALQVPGAPPLPLPLIAPWADPEQDPLQRVRQRRRQLKAGDGSYVEAALTGFAIDGARCYIDGARCYIDRDSRRLLAELLTAGQPPPGQRPSYRPDVETCGDRKSASTLVHRRNLGRLGRSVLTAASADLESHALQRWGSMDGLRMLGPEPVDTGRASKYRADGRRILHRLGVWPWALADDGKLPRGWNGKTGLQHLVADAFDAPFDAERYSDPLRDWHRRSLAKLREQADAHAWT